ncbi:SnoaL-like polyketide cyclase [Colletotrichum truncatum]|uniref:SnoaL-like polyketide cyclase n=1 Tax=Colletotrichum truncatum TaxID=5467 RepID=A0ACC3YW89_COLTU|nr:SnoaL-like polyketide cyclase [Colletotrichum truncatum]KAF6787366.1 SnoaL-like polyketide cyclase [Colletotrichum truncatum]
MSSEPNTMNVFILRSLVHYLDEQNWEKVESSLEPTINYNGQLQSATEFFSQQSNLVDPSNRLERKFDSVILDGNGDSVAARIIHCVALPESPEAGFEFQEIVFAWFANNRLSRWQALRDEDGFQARHATVYKTPHESYTGRVPSPDASLDLEEHYRAYINSINRKTMDSDFAHFCQPELEHNGRKLSISEYIPLISDSQSCIQGLSFHVQELLVDNRTQQIAARLEFTGTPVKEWGGPKPNGKPVHFHEQVMYQLNEGKIVRVWSVVELDAYRKQLS